MEDKLDVSNYLAYFTLGIITMVLFGSYQFNFIYSKLSAYIFDFAFFYVLTTAFSNILSSHTKFQLLFFSNWEYPMPACRAFSKYAKEDFRVDEKSLEEKYSIPKILSPVCENKLWYKIYSEYKRDNGIIDAHRKFLITRDSTFILLYIFLLSLILYIMAYIAPFFNFNCIGPNLFVIILLFILFLIFYFSAQSTAIKLVKDVLALGSNNI